jgi:excinuclease ABC subunit A
MDRHIYIKGARVNNLKNIDVSIPRDKLIVITGLSGSGKSSLAFDTLYAEGQRRYVESLSAYARQFLGRMSKPEVDYIKGIPPAIAIQQKVITQNPRSTVGTSSEVYEYIKLLFARVGKTYSPVSGEEVKKHTTEDVARYIVSLPEDTTAIILVPKSFEKDDLSQQLLLLQQQGFTRIEAEGEILRIQDALDNISSFSAKTKFFLVIDRISARDDKETFSRAVDSAETAFFEGKGNCELHILGEKEKRKRFSNQFEADGITFETPSEQLFSFNSPLGACPKCEGFGKVIGIDEDLVIPNKSLSVYQDAIVCWRGEVMGEWKKELIRNAGKFGFPIHKPISQLTPEQRKLLWTGNEYFRGINDFFRFVEENQYKIQYRVLLARYRGKTLCPECEGARLRKEAFWVKINGKSIKDLVDLPIKHLKPFFSDLKLDDVQEKSAKRLLTEIFNRIQFLQDVGLGYLTLNRAANTLSGGESQRINLATSIGSSLVGSLYILDEPSIGLHSRDTQLLIKVLRQLQALGNTVVVVEHDEEIIRAADYIIDIGPLAGRLGGEIVFEGNIADIAPYTSSASVSGKKVEAKVSGKVAEVLEATSRSFTVKYLTGEDKIEVPKTRRKWSNYILVKDAHINNLKNIEVKFPLNIMTVVTGVSGSGKSSLVREVFYKNVKRYYDSFTEKEDAAGPLSGSLHLAKNIEFVDQNPIGRSSRSNPVTYIKAYDEVRKLFADQQLSKQMGYTPSFFSFNMEGGRCEECQGDGTITVEMQFMADLILECESCHGKRFKDDILEVQYKGVNIYDVLQMTVDQAIEFFSEDKQNSIAQRIAKRIKPLQDVGLGYIQLGQSSSTLSGGENQRVKLASFLVGEKMEPTIFVFDEPTTGLHFHDINTLMKAFNALIERGHTVIIIEHNMDVIKCADHIIDIGPEGGDEGGNVVFAGTPEDLIHCENSYTGKYLREKLEK